MSSLDRNIFELQPLEIRTLLAAVVSVDGTNTLQINTLDSGSSVIVNKISNGKINIPFVSDERTAPEIYVGGNSDSAQALAMKQADCL